jgi:hypothetical protein
VKANSASWSDLLVETAVGPFVGEGGPPSRIRRFYSQSYKALDRFDAEWYECFYDKRDQNWEVCYTWALIMTTIINARAAYNENLKRRESIKTFARSLIPEIQSHVKNKDD